MTLPFIYYHTKSSTSPLAEEEQSYLNTFCNFVSLGVVVFWDHVQQVVNLNIKVFILH